MSETTKANTEFNRRDSLWLLTASPLIWALHFLCSYVTAAVWCAKYAGEDGLLGSVRVAIAIYTVVALLGIGITGWIGYRNYSYGNGSLPHDDDSPEGRHRFMGFSTLLLSGLSAIATIFVAAVAAFIQTCH